MVQTPQQRFFSLNKSLKSCCNKLARRCRSSQLYCFDPRQFNRTPFGNPKTGAFRAKFLLESVMALRARLRGVGSDLLIANGRPEDVLQGAASRSLLLRKRLA